VRGVEDFAVAGREMDVNVGIASLAATELGLVTVMYTAQLGYDKGFAGASVGVIMALAMYLVGRTGFVIGPMRAAGVMTIPELFEKRFGTRVRWLAGLFIVLGGVPVSRLEPGRPELADLIVVAATEVNTDADRAAYVAALKEVL
jgi:SSS family solute:Na+ symporter